MSVHMVQLYLSMRHMPDLAERSKLPRHPFDTHYVVHCALGRLFKELAPRPFSLETRRRSDGAYHRVLAYSQANAAALRAHAEGFAECEDWAMCDWERLSSKPMPEHFAVGQRLGFALRACPVVRRSDRGPAARRGRGKEVDAFLAACWQKREELGVEHDVDVELTREEVYCAWFRDAMARRGCCTVRHVAMASFQLERMVRRTQGKQRTARVIKRPAVELEGQLEIRDAEAFASMVQGGFGRHKSFGFGMLKLSRG